MEKWELIRAVILNQPGISKRDDKKNVDDYLTSLDRERVRYKEKLAEAKKTAHLSSMLTLLSEQEKRNKELVKEMQTIEQPIINEIKHSKVSFQVPDEHELRRRQGNAMLQVRRKRAEMNRVAAKTNATIGIINSKLSHMNQQVRRMHMKRNNLQKFGLPPLSDEQQSLIKSDEDEDEDEEAQTEDGEEQENGRELADQKDGDEEIDTNPQQFLIPSKEKDDKQERLVNSTPKRTTSLNSIGNGSRIWSSDSQHRRATIAGVCNNNTLSKLLNLRETRLQEKHDSALVETTRQLKDELRLIEDKIAEEIHTIKARQKQEIRVQRMRIKYREIVQEKRSHDKMKKFQLTRLQAHFKKLKMEQEIFGLKINSRLSKRNFSYF